MMQTVWPQVRLLRNSLISVQRVCLHGEIILEKILKCTEDIKKTDTSEHCFKNKNSYLIFVNENRNNWVHSCNDTLMQCQRSHKYFKIIHKIFIFQLKLPSFLDKTPIFQFRLPIFSRYRFYNFCFLNLSENSDSDQLHCYYMYVDDLSLMKRRLSYDVAQFLK